MNMPDTCILGFMAPQRYKTSPLDTFMPEGDKELQRKVDGLLSFQKINKDLNYECEETGPFHQHMCIQSRGSSNYRKPSTRGGPVLLDWSFRSRRPSGGVSLEVGVCWRGDKHISTWGWGREQKTGSRSHVGGVYDKLPLFLRPHLQPGSTPISSSRKLSARNLPHAAG